MNTNNNNNNTTSSKDSTAAVRYLHIFSLGGSTNTLSSLQHAIIWRLPAIQIKRRNQRSQFLTFHYGDVVTFTYKYTCNETLKHQNNTTWCLSWSSSRARPNMGDHIHHIHHRNIIFISIFCICLQSRSFHLFFRT